MYYHKYLKYKEKYLRARAEMEGGLLHKLFQKKSGETAKNNIDFSVQKNMIMDMIKNTKNEEDLMEVRKNIALTYIGKIKQKNIKNKENMKNKNKESKDIPDLPDIPEIIAIKSYFPCNQTKN